MTNPTRTNDTANINRAPKGGAISPVNNRFYLGGQFMPMSIPTVALKPAKLEGSWTQIAWANRLRSAALAILDDIIIAHRETLAEARPFDEAGTRRGLKRDLTTYHRLMTTKHASVILDQRHILPI